MCSETEYDYKSMDLQERGKLFGSLVAFRHRYSECMVNIQHQLGCHGSSNDLLTKCIEFVTLKIYSISDISGCLANDSLENRMDYSVSRAMTMLTAAPLIAVLHKIDKDTDPDSLRSVINFTHILSNKMPLYAKSIVNMEGLGESLLLTMKSIIELEQVHIVLLDETTRAFANLVRTCVIMATETEVHKGIDLMVKAFLLCNYINLNSKAKLPLALKVFSKTIINVLLVLFSAMDWGRTGKNVQKNRSAPIKSNLPFMESAILESDLCRSFTAA